MNKNLVRRIVRIKGFHIVQLNCCEYLNIEFIANCKEQGSKDVYLVGLFGMSDSVLFSSFIMFVLSYELILWKK